MDCGAAAAAAAAVVDDPITLELGLTNARHAEQETETGLLALLKNAEAIERGQDWGGLQFSSPNRRSFFMKRGGPGKNFGQVALAPIGIVPFYEVE